MQQVSQKHLARTYEAAITDLWSSIIEIGTPTDAVLAAQQPVTMSQRRNTPRDIAKPVRPVEFRLWTALPFVGLFIALSISLAVLFITAQVNGMSWISIYVAPEVVVLSITA